MEIRERSIVMVVVVFTTVAIAMLWGLTLRWQGELLGEVTKKASQRSLQLADAMSGQVDADLRLLDHVLLDVRMQLADGYPIEDLARKKLMALPHGLVEHMSLVNKQGRVVFNNLNGGAKGDFNDFPHFQRLQTGGDRLEVGAPVESRINGRWVTPVGRPLYRDGQFDGALYLEVSTEFLARRIERLALSPEDVVVLVHPSGRVLARSDDNLAAMKTVVPPDRPFMADTSSVSGNYRQAGVFDGVTRLFGWQRLPESGLVLVVGLAESSVVGPVLTRSRWLTGSLSILLALGGLFVSWLLWRGSRSDRAVREAAERLKEAQRMAKLGNWSLDIHTGQVIWSDEVYRIFGLQKGVYLPARDNYLQLVHPDDRALVGQQIQVLFQSDVSQRLDHRIAMADGSVKYLCTLTVVDRENGKPVCIQGTVQDITELKSAQLGLEKMNNELEGRVLERTRELATLNQELEAFSYSVSHDLRTPLRSIQGFATLLLEESEGLAPEERTHLRRIQDSARRMGQLITELLTMAHHGRAVANPQRVNLSELAREVAMELGLQDPQREVTWAVEPELWAAVDPELMRVVLQNLLGNAWKFTRQTPQARITFTRTGEADGQAEFCVRDNGAGFDMAYADQLFQPFKRLHAHDKFEGTGIGLASVQRLVQRHGGTVRAEGLVGQGAAVFFRVPLNFTHNSV